MNADRELRRRCEERLRRLTSNFPLQLDRFIADVVAARPRPLSFMAVPLLGQPYGLWLTDGSIECIWYERDTTPAHQRHIILHELCHLLCDHQPIDATVIDGPLPHLDRERLQAIMLRSGYSAAQEREAELLASLIMERLSANPDGTNTDARSLRLLQMLGAGNEVRSEG